MLLLLLMLELLLAAVIGVAGVAKLLDRKGTQAAAINFGVPPQFASPLAVLLPFLEIAVGVGLVFSSTAWVSALTAMLLLASFSAAIGFNLQRGRTPDCHCFGQLYSRPLGWSTFFRNLAFAAGAAVVAWQGLRAPAPSLALLPRELGVGSAALAAALLILAASVTATVGVVRKRWDRAGVSSRLSPGLPLGSAAPAFSLVRYHGGTGSLQELVGLGKPLVLIFSNPNCGPCVALFQEVAKWQKVHHEQVTVCVISQGTVKENFVNVARNDLREVLLQREREVAELYRANVTPTAVVIEADGRIGSSLAAGADQIRSLMARLVGGMSSATLSNAQHHLDNHVLTPRITQQGLVSDKLSLFAEGQPIQRQS